MTFVAVKLLIQFWFIRAALFLFPCVCVCVFVRQLSSSKLGADTRAQGLKKQKPRNADTEDGLS